MSQVLAVGEQDFLRLRQDNVFYIDKTQFIVEWWKGRDCVTLCTRPRRFGKTLLLTTVRTFFSPEFTEYSTIFEGLKVWNDEKIRALHNTIPVIFISFAPNKARNYAEAVSSIKESISSTYRYFSRILESAKFSDWEKNLFSSIHPGMDDLTAQISLRHLSECLYYQYGSAPIILLDKYDTPLHEAWSQGYWNKLVGFMRIFFNETFKTNPYLGRGLITGITRVSQESIFSDMNNLEVVTVTSDLYADCFGFTENEIYAAMDMYALPDKRKVKQWYDRFIFGGKRDIYNPWSIINYIKKKKFDTYWMDTCSNSIVSKLILRSKIQVKEQAKELLEGRSITVVMDEQCVFSELYTKDGAIWSLLMAAGYVKPLVANVEKKEYELNLVNHEVHFIFSRLISGMCTAECADGAMFREYLLHNDLAGMNHTLSAIATFTCSYYNLSKNQSECFYHSFVLGLTIDLQSRYEILSNRESGFGRYDVCMIPRSPEDHAIIMEFKTVDIKIK